MTQSNDVCQDTAQYLFENWENGNKTFVLGFLSAKTPIAAAYLIINMMEIARSNGVSHIFAYNMRQTLKTQIEITEGKDFL